MEVVIPYYTYTCIECEHKSVCEHDRGKAPKTIECSECHQTMERTVDKCVLEMERDFTPVTSKTEKIRKNIEKTDQRLNELKDEKLRDGLTKWRLELNGGSY